MDEGGKEAGWLFGVPQDDIFRRQGDKYVVDVLATDILHCQVYKADEAINKYHPNRECNQSQGFFDRGVQL